MPLALITGASMGIGEVFARQLADRGYDLILTARSEDKLQAIATDLRGEGVRVQVIPGDLTDAALRQRLFVQSGAIDLLVNNAGFGDYGPLAEVDRINQQTMIQLNILALVDLTQLLLPGMVKRQSGAIINVASIAAFQPMPYLSVYAATKAFVLSFSEALRAETRSQGIKVQCLCPGATDTNFAAVSGLDRAFAKPDEGQPGTNSQPKGQPGVADADSVVRQSLAALDRDKSIVITGGIGNRLVAGLSKVTPYETIAKFVEGVFRPKNQA
jgi:uncharacterized protein